MQGYVPSFPWFVVVPHFGVYLPAKFISGLWWSLLLLVPFFFLHIFLYHHPGAWMQGYGRRVLRCWRSSSFQGTISIIITQYQLPLSFRFFLFRGNFQWKKERKIPGLGFGGDDSCQNEKNRDTWVWFLLSDIISVSIRSAGLCQSFTSSTFQKGLSICRDKGFFHDNIIIIFHFHAYHMHGYIELER